MENLFTKFKYNKDFLKHTRNKSHIVTPEELRLRKVLLQNYTKSFILCNGFALYFNYLIKNKTFFKALISNIFML